MPIFVKRPVEVEAFQFTGSNWTEMHAFCGFSPGPNGGTSIPAFNRLGTMLTAFDLPGLDVGNATAELWVEANQRWLPIEPTEWVIRDELGFYPCKNEQFVNNYAKKESHGH